MRRSPGGLHRVRLHQAPGHRQADRGPGPRPGPAGRAVPGLAASPVLHQQHRAQADITHRRHAIIETVLADLIDGPLAHQPSGRFAANSTWAICAAITHNLLRAAGTLTSPNHALARGATLRRQIVTVRPDAEANALAMGRRSVAVTTGFLQLLYSGRLTEDG